MSEAKRFAVTSVEIERFQKERYAWIYIHPLPPLRESEDTAANFAVQLRALDGCKRAVSTGDGLDLEYEFHHGLSFRYAFDGIHGMVVECAYADAQETIKVLSMLCAIDSQA